MAEHDDDPTATLDPQLRERLRSLSAAEGGGLAADARARAIDATLAAAAAEAVGARDVGPHRARSAVGDRRVAPAVAVALVGLAAAAMLAVYAGDRRRPPTREPDRLAAPSTSTPDPAAACALVTATRAAALTAARAAAAGAPATRLQLAQHAELLGGPGARFDVEAEAPCRAVVTLRRGRVSVHARDLAGGELWVRSGADHVVVRGTVFTVERRPDGLHVALARGSLEVRSAGGQVHALSAGQSLHLSGEQVRRAPLEAAAREQTLRAHALAMSTAGAGTGEVWEATVARDAGTDRSAATRPSTGPPPPAETKAEAGATGGRAQVPRRAAEVRRLLGEADEARKRGDLARARARYRRAGTGRGVEAETAWLRLGQLELARGRAGAARAALAAHRRRFPRGVLAAEAAWLRVRLAEQHGDRAALRKAAARLLRDHPHAAQAQAAQRLLDAPQ